MLDDLGAWAKALHIMAFAAWLAAMWYLPRLMVYHVDTTPGSDTSETFKTMERRLLKAIGTPAMVATFVFGFSVATINSAWDQGWLHAKLVLLLALAACHGLLAKHVKLFSADDRPRSARWYRMINEVPTLLFVLIVVLAVFRPF